MQPSVIVQRHLPSLLFALSAATTAGAQQPGSFHIKASVNDTVAHVVDRQTADHSRFAIVSRDGMASLLLMDTTIVAQMTDRGLAKMNAKEATDTISGVMNRMFAKMTLGALQPLFDHGIAYHLRDLGDARYEDGRLRLVRKNGDDVFKDTVIGKGQLMESFSPADAKEFAKRAKEARAKLK